MNADDTPLRRDLLANWDVLVVEDDPDSLWVTRRILTHYGAHVHEAHNGREALELLQTLRPAFIICDLSMPLVDGWAVVDAVKHDRALMEIPIIALTAHAFEGDRQRAIAAGFHNYLTKPLTPATFMSDLLVLLLDEPVLRPLLAKAI